MAAINGEFALPTLYRSVLFLAAMAEAVRPQAADAAPVIVELQMAPDQQAGSLKQGLVCLPAGKIKARQLRMPSAELLNEALQRTGHSQSDRPTLRGSITRLDAAVCTSWKGIARTKPKGKMSVEISWSLEAAGGGGTPCTAAATVSLEGEDPRESDKPLIAAIIASLAEADACLAARPQDPLPAP